MSRTRKREKREFDDARFVPPVDPLFSQPREARTVFCEGDLVLGLKPDHEYEDMIPRVGLVIEADIDTRVTPSYHMVLWEDGAIEANVEDDLAPVAHS